MPEEKMDTSQLVGGAPAERHSKPHVDPAAVLDAEASKLNPAKAPSVLASLVKGKRKSRAKAKAKAPKAPKAPAPEAVEEAPTEDLSAAYAAAKKAQVASFADIPADAPLQLRFASEGAFLPGALDVDLAALKPAGMGRTTYAAVADFPPEGPFVRISEAWLIAVTGEAVCCDLGVGLTAGQGHHAKIPAGHLLF